MEYCPRRIGAISQLFAEPVSDAMLVGRHVHTHSVQRTEVICPKPRRALRIPCFVDNLERYNCQSKSTNVHRKSDDGLDFLDIILGKDDLYFDHETSEEEKFFCGSPPVRASNPIVHDVEFVKQSLSLTTQMGNSFSSSFSPRKEISTPCGSPYNDSPKVRIEGFASGSPECRSVVSARA